jgi:hypothetical protein
MIFDEVSPMLSYGGYEHDDGISGGACNYNISHILIVLILIMIWYYLIYLPKQQKSDLHCGKSFMSYLGLES